MKRMQAQMPKNARNHARNSPFHWRGLPSNTWMPGPTPLTMPNDSLITVRNSTQRCNKGPIGNNGMPQIHPWNCSFPFDDHHQNLIHPYQARPHSPSQMASRSNQPCCHSSYVQTDRWGTWTFSNISALLAMLIDSDVLKTEWWSIGEVICLGRSADLHMAQLMPLPLTVSCFSKIQIGFTFPVPAYLANPGQSPEGRKRIVCVCLCVCVCVCMHACMLACVHACMYFKIF